MGDTQATDQIPFLKSTAVLDIKVGAAFVQQLQNTLVYLIEGHGDEVAALEAKGGKGGLTYWETSVVTITTLLQELFKVAHEVGEIDFKPADDVAEELAVNE